MFTKMRTASLLQKARAGSEALPAGRVLRMATTDGARALGLEHEIGSLEAGKKADITIIDLNRIHLTPHTDPVSAIVYAVQASDVRTVIIDGRVVLRDRELTTDNEIELITEARQQASLLETRLQSPD